MATTKATSSYLNQAPRTVAEVEAEMGLRPHTAESAIFAKLERAATYYDIAQSKKRGYNRYALGIYLARLDEVRVEVDAGKPLRQALTEAFNDRLRDHLLKAAGV